MMRKRVVAVLLALSMPLVGVPSAAYADGWRQVPTPKFREQQGLTSFALDGEGAWIAGYEGQKCLLSIPWKVSRVCFLAASGNPVARRYDGTNWREYPLLGVRQAIVAVEAYDGDVWIQGLYGDLAQFNGLSFLPVLGPDGEKKLQDVGPAGVWMSMGGKLYHRTGLIWTQTELPNGPLTVFGVAGRSATEAWMVGNRIGQPYVARWDGTVWTEVATPPTAGLLWDVEIGTGSDIWVTTSQKELAHWNGTEWTVLPAPAAGTLNSFKVDSDNVPWLLYGNVLYSYVNGAFTQAPPLPGRLTAYSLDTQGTSLWGLAVNGPGYSADYALVTPG